MLIIFLQHTCFAFVRDSKDNNQHECMDNGTRKVPIILAAVGSPMGDTAGVGHDGSRKVTFN